jgi:hypothetical protein
VFSPWSKYACHGGRPKICQIICELACLSLHAELQRHCRTFLEVMSAPNEASLKPSIQPSLASHRPLIQSAQRLLNEVWPAMLTFSNILLLGNAGSSSSCCVCGTVHVEQAAVEPPWVDRCSMCLTKWKTLVDAVAKLALRSSAMESILEVCHWLLHSARFFDLLAGFCNDKCCWQ